MKRRKILLLVAAIIGVTSISGRLIYKEYRWKRFAVVEPGKIYRSGQLSGRQLQRAIDKLELKTVICLNAEERDSERNLCAENGVQFRFFAMPASGLGDADDFAEVLQILRDPSAHPVLVHCSAGVARTGTSVALFRIAEQNWTAEEAVDELRSYEKNGHIEPDLLAHIHSMAKTHQTTSTDKTGIPR